MLSMCRVQGFKSDFNLECLKKKDSWWTFLDDMHSVYYACGIIHLMFHI